MFCAAYCLFHFTFCCVCWHWQTIMFLPFMIGSRRILPEPVWNKRQVKTTSRSDFTSSKIIRRLARNNSRCFSLGSAKTDTHGNSFFIRTVSDWNNLTEMVSVKLVEEFWSLISTQHWVLTPFFCRYLCQDMAQVDVTIKIKIKIQFSTTNVTAQLESGTGKALQSKVKENKSNQLIVIQWWPGIQWTHLSSTPHWRISRIGWGAHLTGGSQGLVGGREGGSWFKQPLLEIHTTGRWQWGGRTCCSGQYLHEI